MKNRALLLLLKNKMDLTTYAKLLGCSEDLAESIIKEKINPIPLEIIIRSCDIFNVSMDYFLCDVE